MSVAKPWVKVAFQRATEAGLRCKLSSDASALLLPELAPREFLGALVDAGLLADALMFLAHALPKREAAWWACLCARDADDLPGQKPGILEALAAAEGWVRKPSEETRRAAGTAVEAAGTDHASGWAALAAFMTGGSMAPPHLAPVPPPDEQTHVCAFAAVMTAATAKEKGEPLQRLASLLAIGERVAMGDEAW